MEKIEIVQNREDPNSTKKDQIIEVWKKIQNFYVWAKLKFCGGEKRCGEGGRESFLKYLNKAQADSIVQTRAGLLLVTWSRPNDVLTLPTAQQR
jgi:hypothetical protein